MRTVEEVVEMLDELARMEAEQQVLATERDERRASVVPDEVVEALSAIDAEYAVKSSASDAVILGLRDTIKLYVLELQQTVKGTGKMAVYAKPRQEVDFDRFLGYCTAHPEAKDLIVTAPKGTCTIRGAR